MKKKEHDEDKDTHVGESQYDKPFATASAHTLGPTNKARPGVQRATMPCLCAHIVRLTPHEGGYEFSWRCDSCHRAGVISWAHALPRPVFRGDREARSIDVGSVPVE